MSIFRDLKSTTYSELKNTFHGTKDFHNTLKSPIRLISPSRQVRGISTSLYRTRRPIKYDHFEKYDKVDRTMKRDNSDISNFINTKFQDYDKSLSQAFPSKETIDSQRSNTFNVRNNYSANKTLINNPRKMIGRNLVPKPLFNANNLTSDVMGRNKMRYNPKFRLGIKNKLKIRNVFSPKPIVTSPLSPKDLERISSGRNLYNVKRDLVETAKMRARFKRESIIKKKEVIITVKINDKGEIEKGKHEVDLHAVRWDQELITPNDLKYHKIDKESWRDFSRFIKTRNRTKTAYMGKKKKDEKIPYTYKVKESHIPLDVLFNFEINQIKAEEIVQQVKPKPITFRIIDENDNNPIPQTGRVRFEIEGGGEVLTSFVRKNEEEFFEFLVDFNTNNNKPRSKGKRQPFTTKVSVRKKAMGRTSAMSRHSRLSRATSRQGASSPNCLRVKSRFGNNEKRLSKIVSESGYSSSSVSSRNRNFGGINLNTYREGDSSRNSSNTKQSALKSSLDSSISSEEMRDYMANSGANQPKRPKKNRSSMLVNNFSKFEKANLKFNPNNSKIESMEQMKRVTSVKRSSLKRNNGKKDSKFLGDELKNLEIPQKMLNIPSPAAEQDFGMIQISKLTTMRAKGTPSGLISNKVQEATKKRMTIKSPMKFGRSSQMKIANRSSRLNNNDDFRNQASRIESRISRLNAPGAQAKTESRMSSLFFFDHQNENKVIDIKINNVNKDKFGKAQSKFKDKDQDKKMNSLLRRKNYSKWYIKPTLYHKAMKRTNKKILTKMFDKLEDTIEMYYKDADADVDENKKEQEDLKEKEKILEKMKLTRNPYTKMIKDVKLMKMKRKMDKGTYRFSGRGKKRENGDEEDTEGEGKKDSTDLFDKELNSILIDKKEGEGDEI
ncbi:unnamed protein product [Moneuplotes crassus]|uniref:Uncharacterized protein n=1 Tax=Euplotes crassus TaxID=5936 RepID=A0AAD1XKW5_EUPCR|nr:unnamed protein product [Moneuplotes crassus]